MPTTDERREAAEKLRKLEAENHWEKSRFIVGFIEALGLETRANVGECLLHLADLIELDERVCEVEGSYYDDLMNEFYTDLSCGHHVRGAAREFCFCPECGARVIGG